MAAIGSYIISGFMLGWTKMHYEARIPIMIVFAITFFVVFYYISQITRPRFRVPKEMRGKNRPDTYLMGQGAFDPEKGLAVHNNNPILNTQ